MKTRRVAVVEKLPSDWKAKAALPVPVVDGSPEDSTIYAEQCKTTTVARKIQLQQAQRVLKTFKAKGFCSACQRPFEQGTVRQDHLRDLHVAVEKAREDNLTAVRDYTKAERVRVRVEQEMLDRNVQAKLLQTVKSLYGMDKNIIQANSAYATLTIEKNKLAVMYASLSSDYATYIKTKHLREELANVCATLNRNHKVLMDEVCPHTISKVDLTVLTLAKKEMSRILIKIQETDNVVRWTGAHGIQTYAMEHTVQKLTALTTIWLQKFFKTEDIRLEASFDEKERLKRSVICPGNSGIMSGGQWRRVQLASFMAWKDMNSVGFPLLIMDEACTSMDQSGIHAVQETLRDWCESVAGHTCFFITHEPEQHRDTSIYQNHLRILNKRGRSSVADESGSKRRKLAKK